MLGSLSEAEDAVQKAWLRLSGSGCREVDDACLFSLCVSFALLVGDSDGLFDRCGLLEQAKHEMGNIGA
jgi:hypothetical protein